MDRLNFRIPEFVRIAWASARARKTWEPIIHECARFFIELEHASDRTAIINVRPEDMIGHDYIPLSRVNIADFYQAGTQSFDSAKPWEYRCATGPKAEFLARAYAREEWKVVGEILGYPDCCIEFFLKYWVEDKWFDTTYPMGQGPLLSPVNNILLRWIGIRLVSHLPCSFNCHPTMLIGEQNISRGHQGSYHKEVTYLLEMLSWPMEWSSLHGIAIITTPVFKIITASDALPEKAVIKLEGSRYPRDAGSSLVFPFKHKKDDVAANGFNSRDAMDKAHQRIIDAVQYIQPKSILDLGCGTSLLLTKMAHEFNAFTFGVDSDSLKYPDLCMNIYDFTFERKFDLVLIAEQRSQENPEGYGVLIERIKKYAKFICIYNYNTSFVDVIGQEHDTPSISNRS